MAREQVTVPIGLPMGCSEASPRAARGSTQPAAARVLTYVPDDERAQWVEREIANANGVMQIARTVAQVTAALVDDPAPRPQVLVIDLDAVSPAELFELHRIRDQGWCGTIVALGRAPSALRTSLKLARAIPLPIDRALSDEIVKHRTAVEQKTTQIPVF
jgi:hypothetical protein